jgi:trans-aconitate 2-methyltransferase
VSAQCGGTGNVERFHGVAAEVGAGEPFAEHLRAWAGPWNFAGAGETRTRLEAAGFTGVETWLEPWPIAPPEPREYFRAVCLGPHLARLPEELRDSYLDAVTERIGERPTLDYVRLNIVARRD